MQFKCDRRQTPDSGVVVGRRPESVTCGLRLQTDERSHGGGVLLLNPYFLDTDAPECAGPVMNPPASSRSPRSRLFRPRHAPRDPPFHRVHDDRRPPDPRRHRRWGRGSVRPRLLPVHIPPSRQARREYRERCPLDCGLGVVRGALHCRRRIVHIPRERQVTRSRVFPYPRLSSAVSPAGSAGRWRPISSTSARAPALRSVRGRRPALPA